jgi:hypothetical protein
MPGFASLLLSYKLSRAFEEFLVDANTQESGIMNTDKGFYDYMIKRHPESAEWRSGALSFAVMEGVLPVFTRSAFASWLGFRFSGASIGAASLEARTSQSYIELFTPIDELDPTTVLFRGTTGSETGSSTLFLTNDAQVAATYMKNGGEVMQYEVSQFSLKYLQASWGANAEDWYTWNSWRNKYRVYV